MPPVRHLLAATLALALTACVAEDDLALDGEDDAFLTGGKADEAIDAAGVLHVVNTVSAADLTSVCRVHALAAGNIVAHRTAHGMIADLPALDAIANVGPQVLASLERCWQDHYKDGGTGGWRAAFGLPSGDIMMTVDLVMPAFQSGDRANINRSVQDVVDDASVALDSVVEHAQCRLRGENPGRVWLECRRRKFRPSLIPSHPALDRRWFTMTAEIAADGTFHSYRLDDDGRPSGERQLIEIAGRLEANRTVTVTGWKYLFISPYANDSLTQLLIDLAWSADEVTAPFRMGDWDRFDEVLGETVPVAGGTARQAQIVQVNGTYRYVENDGDDDATWRIVDVAAFAIDRTEVTMAAYAACVQEGKCTSPCASVTSFDTCTWSGDHQYFSTSTKPIVGVTHRQAETFCDWAGKQMVTTDQWHLAAGRRAYPWGEATPTCAHARYAGCGDEVDEVGDRPQGRSAAGVDDLAGNVAEYTRAAVSLDVYAGGQWRETTYATELRGGSFESDAAGVRADQRSMLTTSLSGTVSQLGAVGIRCVREAP